MKSGRIIILAGPSGSGKTTLATMLRENNPELITPPSVTTRPPRPGEVNGKDYHFVSVDEFQTLIKEGGLLEHAEYNHHFYGTLSEEVERNLRAGNTILRNIELRGVEQIRAVHPTTQVVFLLPPTMHELRHRLELRGTEEAEIVLRLEKAKEEMIQAKEMALHPVINADLEVAYREIAAYFKLK